MNKTTKRFFGALTILLTLAILLYLISSGLFSQKKTNMAFPDIKATMVDRLTLVDGQKTLTLSKKNNMWSLDVGGNVDQSKINTLVDLIINTNKDNLISTNKGKQGLLGIGTKKLEFYMGNSKNIINYGKDLDLNKIYFVINKEEKTYSTNNKINDYFNVDFLVIKKEEPVATISPTNQ